METIQIVDIRNSGDFKTISFSGYKKTEVKKQLLINMFNGKIEPACYWCAELVCAGHFMDIWEIFLLYLGKHIHIGNPKLPIYVEKRFAVFRNIMQQGLFYDELQLRNNQTIRDMFAEIICILASSPKKNGFEPIKINRVEEFDITQIQDKLKAPSVQFAEPIFQQKDPKELWIAINEFGYHLSISNNHIPDLMSACYWIEWVIEFENICRSKKQKCLCERRNQIKVEPKFQKEIIWLIWDMLVYEAKQRDNLFIVKTVEALLCLFCIKFTPSSPKKRRYIIYYAVAILTESWNPVLELIQDKTVLSVVVKKINTIYSQIKKNEESPNLDYMFSFSSDLNKSQKIEKSIMQMEMIGNMDPALAGSMDEL
jgi:hypothetical protein